MKDKQTKERFMELRGQGFPLAKIAAETGVSKTTLIKWDRDLKEEIDNLKAVELEALYDKFYLSTRKQVEFFGNILGRIQQELEMRDLSEISTEKLFAMYAHFYREAQHALPELTFRNEEEISWRRAGDSLRLIMNCQKTSANLLASTRKVDQKLTKTLRYFLKANECRLQVASSALRFGLPLCQLLRPGARQRF